MGTKSRYLAGRLVALGAFALPLATAAHAAADECSSLPNPVLVVGSSAVGPFLAKLGPALAGESDPITVIYNGPGSCFGVGALSAVPPTTLTGTPTIWHADGTADTCTISESGGLPITIGVSDVFAGSCNAVLPNGVHDFHGPVQSMTFAVPVASTRQVISAEAAYLTLGYGPEQGGTFWNDSTNIFVRSQTSGTQQMIAHAIGVDANAFFGTSTNADGIVSSLDASTDPDSALGILGMDVYAKSDYSTRVKPIAYQHYGQTAGYLPSSSYDRPDMQNTRDGHYFIQGPIHLLTKVDSSGDPVDPNAKVVLDYLTGATEPVGFDLIQIEAQIGDVPDCAMRVTRDVEDGPFMSYISPTGSCECKFVVEATGETPDECAECDPANTGSNGKNSDCTDANPDRPYCHYGYCEVK